MQFFAYHLWKSHQIINYNFFFKLPAELKSYFFLQRLLVVLGSSLHCGLDNKSQLFISSYLAATKHTSDAFMFT